MIVGGLAGSKTTNLFWKFLLSMTQRKQFYKIRETSVEMQRMTWRIEGIHLLGQNTPKWILATAEHNCHLGPE